MDSEREIREALVQERAQVSRVIDIVRADLPRADVKAQVVAAAVFAVVAAIATTHPQVTPMGIAAGVASGIAVGAALMALWPQLRGKNKIYLPDFGAPRLERERGLTEARHQELTALERIAVRKFRAVQVSYVAAAVAGVLGLIAAFSGA